MTAQCQEWRADKQRAGHRWLCVLKLEHEGPHEDNTGLRWCSEQAYTLDQVLVILQNVGVDTACGSCMCAAFTGSTGYEHTCGKKLDVEVTVSPSPPVRVRKRCGSTWVPGVLSGPASTRPLVRTRCAFDAGHAGRCSWDSP